MLTDTEDFKPSSKARSSSPDSPQDLVSVHGWTPINSPDDDDMAPATQQNIPQQQQPAQPVPAATNNCLQLNQLGTYSWNTSIPWPAHHALFQLPFADITGDVLCYLATQYTVGEMSDEIKRYHPDAKVDAPLMSNRLQRAVTSLASREGVPRHQARKAIQDEARSNGIQVNGKRSRGFARAAGLPAANHGQTADAEDSASEDEGEFEGGEQQSDSEQEVLEDNGAPSIMVQRLMEAQQASAEASKAQGEDSGSEGVEPFNPQPVHDGNFRVFS